MNTEHNHIVQSYNAEQQRLTDEIMRMGDMAAAQLEAALDVVERRDDRARAHRRQRRGDRRAGEGKSATT